LSELRLRRPRQWGARWLALTRLARYEVHLDRKLERTLAMLFKLQELRRAFNPT
jgi:hypothetical protein